MLLINCPVCGERPEDEFGYGGAATGAPPGVAADIEAQAEFLYFRDNPMGRHHEYWVHRFGCRRWLTVERDTLSHEIFACRLASDPGNKP